MATGTSSGILFRGSGAGVDADNSTVTPPLFETPAAGDLLLCYCAHRSTAGTVATPSGWTQIYTAALVNRHYYLFYKIASGGDSAPACVPSGGSASEAVLAQCASFRGTHPTTVVDVADSAGTTLASISNIGPINPISPTANNGMVVVVGSRNSTWTSVAPLTGDGLTWAEIGEYVSAAWNDISIVWDYTVWPSTAPTITSKTFVVTGGVVSNGGGTMVSFYRAP